jgi:penicillin-binding protein 1A
VTSFLFQQYANPIHLDYFVRKYRRQLLIWLAVLSAVAYFLLSSLLRSYQAGLPDVNTLRKFEPAETTRIFSSDGQLIGTLFRENRTWVPLGQISPWLLKAVIATEDARFYEHSGVDPIGVLRAVFVDLTAGGSRQGASTITMQLARNMFLSPERSMERKIKEALLARELERQFTKNEILEFYLNQIYFGSGAYGVQAAASQYFGVPAAKLTPAQAALIAGLPQAPTELSPFVDPQAARDRQMLVLTRMHKLGQLSWDQFRRASDQVSAQKFKKRAPRQQLLKVPYFTSYVIKQLSERYTDEQLYRGGLEVYTTVDLKLQEAAESAVRELVAQDEQALNVHQAALVTLENSTGYIRAMVGGRGFTTKNQFNRAWQSRRQAGSSFKPVVYAAALEAGYTPNTLIDDKPVKFNLGQGEVWEPKNSDGASMGTVPMWLGLQHSRNVVAARLVDAVSPGKVVDVARRTGLEGLQPNLSLALGAVEASPLQMARVYSVFPNDGMLVQPTAILRVLDSEKRTLEDNRRLDRRSALSATVTRTMTWMLQRVVQYGTAPQAALADRAVAGKTGTTDSHRDAWFVGYTTDFTTAVWTGNDDFSRMWGAFGGDLPARIFRRTMAAASSGRAARPFAPLSKQPAVAVELCQHTHLRPNPSCPKKYSVSFDAALVPMERCKFHKPKPKPVPQPAPEAQPSEVGSPTPPPTTDMPVDDEQPLEFVPAPETPAPDSTETPVGGPDE